MTRAILLNSGGIDSRIAAAQFAGFGWELHSLYIVDPRNDDASMAAAEETALLYCASHRIDPYYGPICAGNSEEDRLLPWFTLYAIVRGAQWAADMGIEHVLSGHKRDIQNDAFKDAIQTVLTTSTRTKSVVVHFPLWELTDWNDLMIRARGVGANLQGTYSCRTYPECGKCTRCVERARAGL